MSMDMFCAESKEQLDLEIQELRECLNNIKQMTNIHEYIDLDDYIYDYICSHKDLTIEEIEYIMINLKK